METEYDLHSKVVRFIRKFCPDTLMTVSLDDLQDTSSKRIKAFNLGYQKRLS